MISRHREARIRLSEPNGASVGDDVHPQKTFSFENLSTVDAERTEVKHVGRTNSRVAPSRADVHSSHRFPVATC
jgi:hypothetical protein